MSHFEHGHFTLTQTIESLKIGQALNSSSLDESLSTLSIKLPKMQARAFNSSFGVKGAQFLW